MSTIMMILIIGAAAIVVVRCICILHHTHWSRHPRGIGHWIGFGYSYIALAAASIAGALYLLDAGGGFGVVSVALFLIANSGMILFDRRNRRVRP